MSVTELKPLGTTRSNNKGSHTVSVEIKDGKVAVHVRHAKKWRNAGQEVQSTRPGGIWPGRMASSTHRTNWPKLSTWVRRASATPTWDEYGVEDIYWFPYDMILDGDTGAVYVP